MTGKLEWSVISDKIANDYGSLRTRRRLARHPTTNREHGFIRVETPDWVNVLAITDDDRVVMVEQYRHGISRVTLELPGGKVEPGEAAEVTAARELREETGYSAPRMEQLGTLHPNPAVYTNQCTTWVALGAQRTHDLAPDAEEVIRVVLHPIADLAGLLREGRITDAISSGTLMHLVLREGSIRRPR